MTKKNILICIVFLVCFIFSNHCLAQQVQILCSVIRVLDGDTFHCIPDTLVPVAKIHKDGTISVRMRGIDAPEKRQSYGEEARLSLKELIGGKIVKLDIKDIDRYGRVVAYVWLGNININLEQIKRGMAWAYTEYLDRPYAREFYEAYENSHEKLTHFSHEFCFPIFINFLPSFPFSQKVTSSYNFPCYKKGITVTKQFAKN